MRRSLSELVNLSEPGIELVRQWMMSAANAIELLPCERRAGEETLSALQVTTRSPMGAIAYETGGILVDRGWLRILGAGSPRLPRSIAGWNRLAAEPSMHRLPRAILVADDAVGGFFAVNGGGLAGEPGNVFYLAPDTLRWEDTKLGYSDWLHWTFAGDLQKFYANARWLKWEMDVASLGGEQAVSIYPFLFAEGPPVSERSRRPVPIEELWGLHAIELPRQLGRPTPSSTG
jgi:Protein of unknown function DUF2625